MNVTLLYTAFNTLVVFSTYLIDIFITLHTNVKLCALPVALAPLLSSGLALGRVASTAEV